jgi:hypothetical protein
MSRRSSGAALSLVLTMAALAVSLPVAAGPLTGLGPGGPAVIPTNPGTSPVTNPGPVVPPPQVTPPPTPAAAVPPPANSNLNTNLGAKYSPQVLDMGEIPTPQGVSLVEQATATLTVTSPTSGMVTAGLKPNSLFWVKRLTSFRWEVMSKYEFPPRRARRAVQTVAGNGALPVEAGQELEVEVAFKTGPGDTDRHEDTLWVAGTMWEIHVPVRINVTLLGPMDLLAVPGDGLDPRTTRAVGEFVALSGKGADMNVRVINPTRERRLVTVYPGAMPLGITVSMKQPAPVAIEPSQTLDIPLHFAVSEDAPSGRDMDVEVLVDTGKTEKRVVFSGTVFHDVWSFKKVFVMGDETGKNVRCESYVEVHANGDWVWKLYLRGNSSFLDYTYYVDFDFDTTATHPEALYQYKMGTVGSWLTGGAEERFEMSGNDLWLREHYLDALYNGVAYRGYAYSTWGALGKAVGGLMLSLL